MSCICKTDVLIYPPSPIKAGVDAKELFHLYIVLWIEDKRRALLENCRLDKVTNSLLFALAD